jgi:hypothetical protein
MRVSFEQITIGSLGELVQAVTPAAPDPNSGRLRDSGVYRGVTHPDESLLTSLDRLGSPYSGLHEKRHLEAHLLRNFIRYSRPYLPVDPVSLWELLVTAQQHGLPTRLLDWTYSPLVAAHFATLGGNPKLERVIWRLDWKQVHQRFHLPELALTISDLDRVLNENGYPSLWDLFDESNQRGAHFVCMFEPPAVSPRIISQSATFTLSSAKSRSLDQILSDADLESAITRFVIPAARIDIMRDQLDICGIDERRLFPGLDGVAAQMRRYYWTSAQEGEGE